MAELAGKWMEDHKVKFIRKHIPTKVRGAREGQRYSVFSSYQKKVHIIVLCLYSLLDSVVIVYFLYGQVELIEEGPPRKLKVDYKSTETGDVASDEFNTVRLCVG